MTSGFVDQTPFESFQVEKNESNSCWRSHEEVGVRLTWQSDWMLDVSSERMQEEDGQWKNDFEWHAVVAEKNPD